MTYKRIKLYCQQKQILSAHADDCASQGENLVLKRLILVYVSLLRVQNDVFGVTKDDTTALYEVGCTRKGHIPPDLVVDHWTSDVESNSPLDFLLLHALWTPFGRLMSYKIISIISVACDFTTKFDGMCK